MNYSRTMSTMKFNIATWQGAAATLCALAGVLVSGVVGAADPVTADHGLEPSVTVHTEAGLVMRARGR